MPDSASPKWEVALLRPAFPVGRHCGSAGSRAMRCRTSAPTMQTKMIRSSRYPCRRRSGPWRRRISRRLRQRCRSIQREAQQKTMAIRQSPRTSRPGGTSKPAQKRPDRGHRKHGRPCSGSSSVSGRSLLPRSQWAAPGPAGSGISRVDHQSLHVRIKGFKAADGGLEMLGDGCRWLAATGPCRRSRRPA
jgi:hypothetical protein